MTVVGLLPKQHDRLPIPERQYAGQGVHAPGHRGAVELWPEGCECAVDRRGLAIADAVGLLQAPSHFMCMYLKVCVSIGRGVPADLLCRQ